MVLKFKGQLFAQPLSAFCMQWLTCLEMILGQKLTPQTLSSPHSLRIPMGSQMKGMVKKAKTPGAVAVMNCHLGMVEMRRWRGGGPEMTSMSQ